MKDLLVVSGIEQILSDMMQAKQALQQTKDDKNCRGAVEKGNIVVDIFGAVRFDSETSAFKIRGAIGEAVQKDKLSYVSLLKQIKEWNGKDYSEKEIVNALLKAICPGLYLWNVLENPGILT